MIATCQFCQTMIQARDVPDDAEERTVQFAYRQLSLLVANHMSAEHPNEVGSEIAIAMSLAGAAVAMRYVASSDARIDEHRNKAGRALQDAFEPAPPAPLVSLSDKLPEA